MNYKEFKALQNLAVSQGIQLITVADFVKFAKENNSKKTVKTQINQDLVLYDNRKVAS